METSNKKLEKLHEMMTWTWQRNGNLKRETESLQINDAMWTNYVKAKSSTE